MTAPGPDAAAEALLGEALAGALLHRALAAFVALRLPDAFGEGPADSAALASATGAHGHSLQRLLRFLAGRGVVAEDRDGRFSLTAVGRQLRGAGDGSLAARLAPGWQDLLWRSLQELPEALRSGRPAFDIAFGRPLFQHLAAEPAAGRAFDRAMARVSAAEDAAIAGCLALDGPRWIVDVGGGAGGLLAAIRRRAPALRLTLFDRADVVAAGVPPGIEAVAGDFFAQVPAGADLYLLKRILHDWSDASAVALLARIRAVLAGASARLLVIEAVLAEPGTDDPLTIQDLAMLALTPGAERRLAEFQALASAAGFHLAGDPVPVPDCRMRILEFVPA